MDRDHRDALIVSYFHCGYDYATICTFLKKVHGTKISLRHLKRFLNKWTLPETGRTRGPGMIYK